MADRTADLWHDEDMNNNRPAPARDYCVEHDRDADLFTVWNFVAGSWSKYSNSPSRTYAEAVRNLPSTWTLVPVPADLLASGRALGHDVADAAAPVAPRILPNRQQTNVMIAMTERYPADVLRAMTRAEYRAAFAVVASELYPTETEK